MLYYLLVVSCYMLYVVYLFLHNITSNKSHELNDDKYSTQIRLCVTKRSL